MNGNLLIIGAGVYAVVVFEIANEMGCFEKIDFVDDGKLLTPHGIRVIGTTSELERLATLYDKAVVAIGNSKVRLALIQQIEEKALFDVVSLISPKAYISPTAQIGRGCIIEPMAVVHTGSVISAGCILSAGAVVNHASICLPGVHIDCNATVLGYSCVPEGTKICSGSVFKNDVILANSSLQDIKDLAIKKT